MELPERVQFKLGHAEVERHPGNEIKYSVVVYNRSDLRLFALESVVRMDEIDREFFPHTVTMARPSHEREAERAWIIENGMAEWLITFDMDTTIFRFHRAQDAFAFKMRFG